MTAHEKMLNNCLFAVYPICNTQIFCVNVSLLEMKSYKTCNSIGLAAATIGNTKYTPQLSLQNDLSGLSD